MTQGQSGTNGGGDNGGGSRSVKPLDEMDAHELRSKLHEVTLARDEVHTSLKRANADRKALRMQLERARAAASAGSNGSGAVDPAKIVFEAERQRMAWAGLLSDAVDSQLRSEPPTWRSLKAKLRAPSPPPPVDLKRLSAKLLDAPSPGTISRHAPPSIALSLEGVSKSFVIPSERVDSLKMRLIRHPLRRMEYRRIEVLHEISFQVKRGEFLGVVGTNGAGKSTLLKLIASTYRPDHGRIQIAGRIAPLIELGVGFHPELTAHDNVIMSASMLGLTPERAEERWPAIMEFSGLEEFAELKLRNYSSGMRVRLAFAVAMEVDADILLIDEVLAVGDQPFQERCGEALQTLHKQGKTILFVSHSMQMVKASCDRAVLIAEGRVAADGHPEIVADRYEEIMLERQKDARPHSLPRLEPTDGGPA